MQDLCALSRCPTSRKPQDCVQPRMHPESVTPTPEPHTTAPLPDLTSFTSLQRFSTRIGISTCIGYGTFYHGDKTSIQVSQGGPAEGGAIKSV